MKATQQTIADLAWELLYKQDMPCHVDEIARHVRTYCPCKPKSLVGRCRIDKRFILIKHGYIGLRTKKYNLANWKKENFTVWATIADLVEHFLNVRDTPCHLDTITQYILQYRKKSNRNAVVEHCQSDSRFFQIKDYIGLRSKKYDLRTWKKQHVLEVGDIGDFMEVFLDGRDEPCHVNKIAKYVAKYRKSNTQSIINACQRDKRFFTIMVEYIGLWSKKYDIDRWKKDNLRKWKKTISHSIVTVCDFAEDFLAQQKSPCHINEITAYVKKYRPTNARYLMSRLCMDKRFIRVAHGYAGLKSKNYDIDKWKKQYLPPRVGDLMEECLGGHNVPLHQDEILKYIKKYRACSVRSIVGLRKTDKRFITVRPEHIGLRKKNYDLEQFKKQNIAVYGTMPDYIVQFLHRHEEPCRIKHITRYLMKFYPNITENSVKRTCKGNTRLCLIGSYACLSSQKRNLEKWKDKHVTEFGTISDIMADFLSRRNSLCHVDVLTKYVKKYRAVNTKQAKFHLRDRRFVIYKNGYAGLWGKEYSEKQLAQHKIKRAGTVGDLAWQYIAERRKSCTVDEIVRHIGKYRQADPMWITVNLKEERRFNILKNGRISLRKIK